MLDSATSIALGPEDLSALGSAFEQAWSALAIDFNPHSTSNGGARLRLATIVMALAKDGTLTHDEIRDRSVLMMRGGDRAGFESAEGVL